MASAVPYDPYDDLDNNPFAEPQEDSEPIATNTDGSSSMAKEQINAEEAIGSDQAISTVNSAHNENATQSKTSSEQSGNKQLAQPLERDVLPERSDEKRKYSLLVKVVGLERFGSTAGKKENPTIVFDCSTNLPTFRKQHYKNVKKSYEEFNQLFKYLNAAIQESFVPTLPPAFTTFGINSEEDRIKVTRNFQLWFNRVSQDPLIIRNEEVAFFIESDFNTYTPISKSKLLASGLKRKTLKQLAIPYDEVTELAEFRPLVKSIYVVSQNLQEKLLKVSRNRRMMVQEENAFGQDFVNLDDHNKLYKRYGKILTAVGDIDSIIATMDMATLYDGLEWVIRDTYVVKEALTNRHFIMRNLIQAQQNSKAKQEQARRFRSRRDINPMKIDEALRQLKTATKSEQVLTLKLQRITLNMVIERKQWLTWYEEWIRNSIKEFTLRKIEYERKKLTLLERVRSDIRKADENGGLSRLGRHAVSVSNTDTSQTVKGDSWTGENNRKSQIPINKITHTEFDDELFTEDDGCTSQDSDTTSLNARHAASLLGMSTK
ncbi:Vps17p [Saccharomyces cerevisiae x Saccharomyces kudriavzevii VIN7]|uniref:Vacuolar protein sorting-associated protein 17 n=1 Tax=Saccharomyces cerevisiae x Saccharomyces kudriavzevii (strain VIN7) TaxID=1095631 RepID=H0H165_SACCK|nr:Vps17p [Saccharomyces cerevisiae x Saccharomyces kudriavzevii VIN7]